MAAADRSRRTAAAVLLAAALVLLTGCRIGPRAPEAYYGPTDDVYTVIEDINRNNARIETLWSRGRFQADVRERLEDGREQRHRGSGRLYLLYRRPGEVRMTGDHAVAGRIFDLGSNPQNYWLIVRPADTMWFGAYAAGASPQLDEVPIRPDLMLEVLGVGTIDSNLTSAPFPVMRFNNDQDAYMFVWNERLPDRWIAQKEVWYDRDTKLPRLVNLFDEDGRVVLSAYLSQHERIEMEGVPREQRPLIATSYRLFFPDTGTRMWLDLADIRETHDDAPDDLTFRFPGPQRAGVNRVISLDHAAP
jgi:hypothetical protein